MKDNTIEKVLGKDDGGLAMEVLMGKRIFRMVFIVFFGGVATSPSGSSQLNAVNHFKSMLGILFFKTHRFY